MSNPRVFTIVSGGSEAFMLLSVRSPGRDTAELENRSDRRNIVHRVSPRSRSKTREFCLYSNNTSRRISAGLLHVRSERLESDRLVLLAWI